MSGAPARLLAAAIACVLGLGIASCGGDPPTDGSGPVGLGSERAGSVASLAQCRDWNEGGVQEKLATIAQLRWQGPSEDGEGTPPVSDEAAFEVIEDTCANGFAAGFRLYKIYARAATFGQLAD